MQSSGYHLHLHSFPTRRSSDLNFNNLNYRDKLWLQSKLLWRLSYLLHKRTCIYIPEYGFSICDKRRSTIWTRSESSRFIFWQYWILENLLQWNNWMG